MTLAALAPAEAIETITVSKADFAAAMPWRPDELVVMNRAICHWDKDGVTFWPVNEAQSQVLSKVFGPNGRGSSLKMR